MRRIPGTVQTLMMALDDIQDIGRDVGNPLQQLNGILRVALQLAEFRFGEMAPISENSDRNVLFAEIMEESGHADQSDLVMGETKMAGDDHGKGADIQRV